MGDDNAAESLRVHRLKGQVPNLLHQSWFSLAE